MRTGHTVVREFIRSVSVRDANHSIMTCLQSWVPALNFCTTGFLSGGRKKCLNSGTFYSFYGYTDCVDATCPG